MPSTHKSLIDISYGSHQRQKMDIYIPSTAGHKLPVVLAIHGGRLFKGKKEDLNASVMALVRNGYAVINMNYRLIDATGLYETPIPHLQSKVKMKDQLADIDAALAYVFKKSREWNLSREKWAIYGHSAGATLAILYGNGTFPNSSLISVIGNVAGMLNTSYEDESQVQFLNPLMVEVFYRAVGLEPINENKVEFDKFSPLWYTAHSDKAKPIINIRAEYDEAFPDAGIAQYDAYNQMLEDKKIPHEYKLIRGASHKFPESGKWDEVAQALADFFGLYVAYQV